MPLNRTRRVTLAAAVLASLAGLAGAADWSNNGGNAGRNGFTAEIGPDAPDILWSGSRPSFIGWQPIIAGRRVFTVRQSGFPPSGEPGGSTIVAQNLDTGVEAWDVNLPFQQNDWTTWIAGTSLDQVYVSRSGNGASVEAPLYALDQATGAVRWTSTVEIDAGAYDGVVFAPDGDPVVASFRDITRFNAADGSVQWSSPRVGSVSGTCGGAIFGDAIYVADAVFGGHAIKKFDLATGAFLYQSPVLAGFTIQNTPMVGRDGTIYLSRTQNNAAVDFFYAIDDDGAAMTIRWSTPAAWSTESEFAVAADGSVYMYDPGNILTRRSSATGAVLAQAETPIAADFSQPRMAVDEEGRLFLSNGAFGNGRVFSFNSDLSLRWSVPAINVNIGAPALGADGTLIVATPATITAYRSERSACGSIDFDGDGDEGTDADIEAFFAVIGGGPCPTGTCGSIDFDGDGDEGTDADIEAFFRVIGGGPCSL